MPQAFAATRYDQMIYRRCGKWGLKLPAISLGAWETFGGYRGEEVARECLLGAFDAGITHFDLANNYGDPPGNAEKVCGKVIREMPRDELIISTKAGCPMWPGPYGDWGSKKSLIASCDQSLRRTGLEYFDIFYSHRCDPDTPLEETMAALDQIVRQGKALYIGTSNYPGSDYLKAAQLCEGREWAPITIHQPHYNMLSRGIESDLLPHARKMGTGIIAYCPLASGLLTGKYTGGQIPAGSRAAEKWGKKWLDDVLTPQRQQQLRQLQQIAERRGQTLSQLALAWTLHTPGMTSLVVGASSLRQIQENLKALNNLEFSEGELDEINRIAPA